MREKCFCNDLKTKLRLVEVEVAEAKITETKHSKILDLSRTEKAQQDFGQCGLSEKERKLREKHVRKS